MKRLACTSLASSLACARRSRRRACAKVKRRLDAPGLRLDRRRRSAATASRPSRSPRAIRTRTSSTPSRPSSSSSRSADLLIVAGLELEIGYLPPLLDQSRNDKIHPGNAGYLDASVGCDILQRPTAPGHARHGRRPPLRQPALLDRPGQRPRDRARDRREALGARPRRQGGLREEPRGLRGEARREGEGVGRRRWRRTRARRSSRSTTRGRTSPSTSSSTSPGTSSPSPASRRRRTHTLEIINLIKRAEDPGHPRRALLRHEDPEVHRRPRRARRS